MHQQSDIKPTSDVQESLNGYLAVLGARKSGNDALCFSSLLRHFSLREVELSPHGPDLYSDPDLRLSSHKLIAILFFRKVTEFIFVLVDHRLQPSLCPTLVPAESDSILE